MRLFVGLDLPWETRDRLGALVGGVPGARWVPVENYHVTLRFIGEVPGHHAEDIDHALSALRGRAFDLHFSGVGTFAKGGRDVALWAGVERNPALEHVQSKIETALQRTGLAPERKRFQPHVTLARLDGTAPERLAAFLQARNLFREGPMRVRHFTLFSSRLGKEAFGVYGGGGISVRGTGARAGVMIYIFIS